ncbi:MAG: 3'(2'),5'-bisphosphate nucleotidase CysQ [Burkholderiaceae bacterium]
MNADRLQAASADDHALARILARSTGELLMSLRRVATLDGRPLGQAGDRIAQAHLDAALRMHRPDDGVLSEEAADDRSRLRKRRVWVIDPLDGTREFSEGRPDWAVHVALVLDGEPTAAAISLPALDEVWCTRARTALAPAPAGPPRIVVSRSRPPAIAERVARILGATLVPMGSAGAKFAALMRGEASAYVHDGGMNEWDSCAPAAVAASMGLRVVRLDGSPMRYNRADPSLPDFVACRPELAGRLDEAIRAA